MLMAKKIVSILLVSSPYDAFIMEEDGSRGGRPVLAVSDVAQSYNGASAEKYGTPGNYVNGANITGFVRVVEAMLDQGLV